MHTCSSDLYSEAEAKEAKETKAKESRTTSFAARNM
jgi:hypothetical protein